MNLSNKLYDYEIQAKESNLINEKINYTAKRYFFTVNNFSKEISKIENEINLLHPNTPIKINELIYNQHFIIKELISLINQKEKNCKSICQDFKDSNIIEKHIITFSILSPINNNGNSFRNIGPTPMHRKKIKIITNSSNRINTTYSKRNTCNSLEKKIINSLSTYENDLTLKSSNKKSSNHASTTEKTKNKNYKINKFSSIIPSKETYECLKYKLKYKYYRTSFLNSFVSGSKNKNKLKTDVKNSKFKSTNRYSYEKKKNKNNNISYFNASIFDYSKNSKIKRVKSIDKQKYKKYNLKILDDRIVKSFLDRTNVKQNPKANKYVKKLYFISNEKINNFQRKITED